MKSIDQRLAAILNHTKQFALIVDSFASSVTEPIMYDSNMSHYGFRYMGRTAKHFCMLKAVRAVSGLNAAVNLAKAGFSQEAHVLIRTIYDFTTQINFVLAGLNGETLNELQQKYIDKFFDDFRRNDVGDFKKSTMRQGEIHEEIRRHLEDEIKVEKPAPFKDKSVDELMSNIYLTLSNFVHARYPEIMDMYGGSPAHFHMEGMSKTPKDNEVLLQIESFTDTVAICLATMIQKFDMRERMQKIPEVAGWIKDDKK